MGRLTEFVSDQLREQLEEYICKNHLQPGDALPSERHLCEIFFSNRVTLRKCLQNMQQEGLIVTIHGRGNFIATPKITEDAHSFISYTSGWEADGYEVSSKVLDFFIMEAPKKIAHSLQISIGTPIYQLKRLRFLNNEPLFLETAYIPVGYCPDLMTYDFTSTSLYHTLLSRYQIHLIRQEHTIAITKLDAQEAALLDCNEGDAAFFEDGITYDVQKRPIEHCFSMCRADRYKMFGHLSPV